MWVGCRFWQALNLKGTRVLFLAGLSTINSVIYSHEDVLLYYDQYDH